MTTVIKTYWTRFGRPLNLGYCRCKTFRPHIGHDDDWCNGKQEETEVVLADVAGPTMSGQQRLWAVHA